MEFIKAMLFLCVIMFIFYMITMMVTIFLPIAIAMYMLFYLSTCSWIIEKGERK